MYIFTKGSVILLVFGASPVSVHPAGVIDPGRWRGSLGVSRSLPRVTLLREDTAEHLQRQEASSSSPHGNDRGVKLTSFVYRRLSHPAKTWNVPLL